MLKHLPFKHLKKSHLYEEVADQIKQAVFRGDLKPGDRLPSERELSEAFGVGRPTVREALRRLEMLGLVEINTGIKGCRVREPDITRYMDAMKEQVGWLIRVRNESIADFWEVHSWIELGISFSVSVNATQKDFDALDELVKKMEDCGNDVRAYFSLSREFHERLALATRNRAFYLVWDILNDIISKWYGPIIRDLFPQGPSKLIEVNKAVLMAIKSKNRSEIKRAMETHVEQLKCFPRTLAEVKGRKK
jgi:DNA-binding FadR family transcriptional regulator